MFSDIYKLHIPRLVRRLGVISSASGVVRSDIESVAKRRNPFCEIVLCPAYVQGEKAVPSLLDAMNRILAQEPDVIIMARGGGAECDMEVFNSRELADAIFASPVPVISAIGHTPYEPILNMVADMKAGTPSEAAEKAVCNVYDLLSEIREKNAMLQSAMRMQLATAKGRVTEKRLLLEQLSPESKTAERRVLLLQKRAQLTRIMMQGLQDKKKRIEGLSHTAEGRMQQLVSDHKKALAVSAARLQSLSPLARISAGYAFAEDASGHGISSVTSLKKEDRIRLYMKDGRVLASVIDIEQEKLTEGEI